jgi:hypothetical protein
LNQSTGGELSRSFLELFLTCQGSLSFEWNRNSVQICCSTPCSCCNCRCHNPLRLPPPKQQQQQQPPPQPCLVVLGFCETSPTPQFKGNKTRPLRLSSLQPCTVWLSCRSRAAGTACWTQCTRRQTIPAPYTAQPSAPRRLQGRIDSNFNARQWYQFSVPSLPTSCSQLRPRRLSPRLGRQRLRRKRWCAGDTLAAAACY